MTALSRVGPCAQSFSGQLLNLGYAHQAHTAFNLVFEDVERAGHVPLIVGDEHDVHATVGAEVDAADARRHESRQLEPRARRPAVGTRLDHDEITDWSFFKNDAEDVVYTRTEGTTDPAAPGTEGFWVASVSGSGEQTLDWTTQAGEWAGVK